MHHGVPYSGGMSCRWSFHDAEQGTDATCGRAFGTCLHRTRPEQARLLVDLELKTVVALGKWTVGLAGRRETGAGGHTRTCSVSDGPAGSVLRRCAALCA